MTQQELIIQVEEKETGGRAYIERDGEMLGEMSFSKANPNNLIINHTFVHGLLRGSGAGKKLLMTLVEKARTEKLKVIPLCPFAYAQFQKDKTIQDVLN